MVRAHLAPPTIPLSDLAALPLPGVRFAPATTPVLVALSGGPDSTALLLWLRTHGADVVAAHFDHALRPESADEAKEVRSFCSALGIPCLLERRAVPMPAGSRQAAARTLRLAFLERAADQAGAGAIAVAHTADDVVEGVLLHLLRGAALPGLRGMPPRRGRIVRPFWGVWRRDVETYLGAAGVTPLRDPSNQDLQHYARVRVRTRLLPELRSRVPGLDGRVWRVALRAVAWTEELERTARACGPALDRLAAATPAVRGEVYRQLHGELPALDRRQLEAVDRLVSHGVTGDGLDLPAGRLWRDRDRLVLEPIPPAPPALPRPRVHWCDGCGVGIGEGVHLAPGGTPPPVRTMHRRPGLRMRPAGGAGTRKLQDLLVDAGVPRRHRDALALLCDEVAEDRLLWVPGVARAEGLTVDARLPGWHVSLEAGPPIGGEGWRKG